MTDILIAIVGLLSIVLLAFSTVYFKKVFYFYFFVFVPCYGFFLEICSRITPLAASTAITATKDYVWIFILVSFFVRQLIKPSICLVPPALAMWLFVYILYSLSTISMSMANIGFTGLALGVRNAFMYIPALFIAACLVRDGKDILALLYRFRFMMIVIGLYAIAQMVFGMESLFNILRDRADLKNVVTSTFLSYIELSYFSCICLAMLVASFKLLPGKTLTVTGISLAVFCVVISQSRTGLIMLLLVFIPFALTKARIFAGIILIAAVVVILFGTFSPEIFYSHRLYKEAFATQRFIDWMTIFPWIFRHAVFGYGLGSFGPAAWKAVQMGQASVSQAYYMDSFFLTTLLNTGIVGLSIFLLLITNVFVFVRRAQKHLKEPHVINFVSGAQVVLLLNLGYSVFFNMIDGFPGSFYFWFFVGAVCAICIGRSKATGFVSSTIDAKSSVLTQKRKIALAR